MGLEDFRTVLGGVGDENKLSVAHSKELSREVLQSGLRVLGLGSKSVGFWQLCMTCWGEVGQG